MNVLIHSRIPEKAFGKIFAVCLIFFGLGFLEQAPQFEYCQGPWKWNPQGGSSASELRHPP